MGEDERIGGSRFLRGASITQTVTGVAVREVTARALTRSVRASDTRRAAAARQQLRAARSLVTLLAGMRGAAMKVGQTLSAVDLGLVPEEVRPELQAILATLQQDAEPVPFTAITAVLEEDSGARLATVFAELDPVPIAAASIGQVHRGTLHDGREVAVKVQYPGIAEAIHADLRNLRLGLKLLSAIAPGIDTAQIAAEIRERITDELDYELEAESQRALARLYRGHPFALVPDVVLEHSSDRVLVSEYVEGRRFAEIAETATQPERNRLGEHLVRFLLSGPMRHGLLNGDPHPGNVLFPADGRIAFLDFGFCKRLGSREIGQLVAATRATRDEDARGLLEVVAALGALPPEAGLAEPFLEHYSAIFGWLMAEQPLRIEPGLTADIMRRYTAMRGQDGFGGLTLPADHFVLIRSVMLVLGLLGRLGATNPWFEITREWLDDAPATAGARSRGGALPRTRPARQDRSTGMSTTTPTISGLALAQEMLRKGLSTDGRMIRGHAGSDIVRWRIGTRVGFALTHPDYVDHVLHEGTAKYHKSIEYELLRAALGLSIFTDEDASWRRHRMMLNPTMSKRNVRGMVDLMIDPIETFMAERDTGEPRIEIEMVEAMTELTLDIVGASLFGNEMGDLARKLKRAVTDALRTAEVGARLMMVFDPPVWLARGIANAVRHAPLRIVPPPLDKASWALKVIDKTMWETIHERQANPNDSPDLLNLLLKAEDDQGKLPLQRVRDEATTFMLAGHETTANALAWMWYLLALNTDARDRMLEEVDTVLEGRRPTIDDLPHLPWTTACFEEGMRLMTPVWVIPRLCVEDDVIDGHKIPKGATVYIPVDKIHHDERFWPDPDVFDPNRFMPGASKGRHRSAFLTFGGGRRICIGTSFALMEATLIAAMMSQEFVYDLVPGHPVEAEATLTLRPRNGVRMIARRRVRSVAAVVA